MSNTVSLPPVPSFEDFLREVRFAGQKNWKGPYPWQQKLAERCATVGAVPPEWVVAPTGSGKTTAVDALVWGLAMQAEALSAARTASTTERTASTRMVWAIDRRILVDEVYERASTLAETLEAAVDDRDHLLHGMALRLLSLAVPGEQAQDLGSEERRARGIRPLAVTRWRGGLVRDSELLSPFQPEVITSTVGQIGSRLLFRGYGVSAGSLALSAGLAGCDTTICLDEAHLAAPFRETVVAIRARRRKERSRLAVPDLRLVTLTATPPEDLAGDVLDLGPEDHSRLGKRWTGSKELELRDADGTTDEQLASAVQELYDEGRLVIACVANRVLTARLVYNRLDKAIGSVADVLLLMGPQRQTDRERQLAKHRPVLVNGERPKRPLVVVATQTVEVGVDFDFDAMVTQSASASALTQRLGRLNRSGERPGRAIAIRDEGFPLYASDEEAAWRWLSELPRAPTTIDVSVRALTEDKGRPADTRQPFAATLTDAIVKQLAQTSERPAPFADPAIQPLLAGPEEAPPTDVSLVWRCDLRIDDTSPDGRAYRDALLALAAPRQEETLTVSVAAARALVAARGLDETPGPSLQHDADIEGGGRGLQSPERRRGGDRAPFVVRRGRDFLQGAALSGDSTDSVTLSDLRAGDTVILPTSLGGSDRLGLNHLSHAALDVGPDLDQPEGATHPTPLRVNREVTHHRIARASKSSIDEAELRARTTKTWRQIARALDDANSPEGPTHDEYGDRDTLPSEQVAALIDRLRNARSPAADEIASWLELEGDWAWRLRRVDPGGPDDLDLLEAEVEDVDDQGNDVDDEEAPSDAATASEHPLDLASWVLVPVSRAWSTRDERAARVAPPTLLAHAKAVSKRAHNYLTALDLDPAEAQAIELAALAHDGGKSDPRFQAFLADGTPDPDRPLAKSTFGTDDPRRSRLARRRAGVPSGFSHAAASVTALAVALERGAIPDQLSAAAPALALHLTGTHHGHGRPIWGIPAPDGIPAIPFDVNVAGITGVAVGDESDGWLGGRWLQQFDDLVERYGPWTLAYLESLLVLADRTVSREGG